MSDYIQRPFDPARKRYYIVSPDHNHNPSDYMILNEDEFIRNRKWAGHIEVREYAGKDCEGNDRYYSRTYGLPEMYAKPRLKVGVKNQPLDAYVISRKAYISTRAKNLLESIDPEAFEFAECETISRPSVTVEPYWMMTVVRVVREFDEEHSVFREFGGRDPRPVPVGQSVGIRDLYEIRMLPAFPDAWNAFYLLKYSIHYIFSEAIVDKWRRQKFTGVRFSPLQTPTNLEEKNYFRYYNHHYFSESGRKYWEDLVEWPFRNH